MSGDREELPDAADAAGGQEPCMPCRGTGLVISRLGGSPAEVTCPWCQGSGVRLSGVDAQAGRPKGGNGAPPDQVA